ncbi:tigger transposable element-derived protein 4 [Trichonephila clavipes]|uniref:Tigger transposable element-derived protein 4 n=1 Tax=Trichonephila clavipes TaxID=2585209 RepID=A0A8X6RP31_TRICX|nr:tigger transposable element-derived protein 4 [Trichonephila clavipes]
MAKSSRGKQTAISLRMKIELLKAVDQKQKKTEICKDIGIANSTLSTIIKKRENITKIFEQSKIQSERKRMRTAKHEDLEKALLVWLKNKRGIRILPYQDL